jgi:hypothetical protein
MSSESYLDPTELAPKPDPATGKPAPPRAPGFTRIEGSQGTDPNRESNPAKAPAPPKGQGPVLVWFEPSRRGLLVGAAWSAAILVVGMTIVTATMEWFTAWYMWLIVILGIILIYGAERRMKISAGAEWLQRRRSWVRIYELMKVTAHSSPSGVEIRLADHDGRKLSVMSDEIQRDRYLWDLVYNGISHSVIVGGAETNNLLHRAFQVPRPKPNSAR